MAGFVGQLRSINKETNSAVKMLFGVDLHAFDTLSVDIEMRARNMRPWLEDVFVPTFREMEQKMFETDGSFGNAGDKWDEPYSDAYEKKKRYAFSRGEALSDQKERFSLDMMQALTGDTSDSVVEYGANSVTLGADPVSDLGFHYAGAQQLGTEDFPARPPVIEEIPQYLWNEIGQSAIGYILFGAFAPVVVS